MLKSLKCLMPFAVLSLFILAGCNGEDETNDADSSNASTADSGDAGGGAEDHAHDGTEGHSHGADDALVWEGDPQMLGDLEIKLGHHATTLHAGESVEPAVSITRDGEPVADAEVFNSLLGADGETVLAEEVATVYEPETPDEPAHYAQGELAIPEDVTSVTIRFRIVVAEGEEETFDVQVPVE